MGPLSLGRPKWEGALGPREPMRGRRLGGASWKLPPSPLGATLGRGTLGRSP
jgi:hypothetical protein